MVLVDIILWGSLAFLLVWSSHAYAKLNRLEERIRGLKERLAIYEERER